MNTSKEIAEKYVYGRHDALTDSQEIEDMIKDIESFSQSQWISIKDELPEDGEVVDIWMLNGKRQVDVTFDAKEQGARQWYNFKDYGMPEAKTIYLLTHWKRQPEPPKN